MDFRDQTFGIEIELTGISRKEAAIAIADYLETSYVYVGGTYREYHVEDNEDRTWKLVYDSSITPQQKSGGQIVSADDEKKVELVSPICKYEDIELVQNLVRLLRSKGGFTNSSAGIHVHIGSAQMSTNQLRNLVNIVHAKEDLIYQALQVGDWREERYCKKTDENFLKKLNDAKPQTREELKTIWYGGGDGSNKKYHDSRYRCLNFHSLFRQNTVEFRAFNSELNPEKIKAYIQFCLSLTALAQSQKSASPTKAKPENQKYAFRCFLLRLGMIGDEFKTTRKHLLSHLEGNSAWRDPTQAQAQKERLRAKQAQIQTQQEQPQEHDQHPEQDNQTSETESGFSMTMQ